MSKDDACKVTSAGKHKERKPKKPHYIPRPWGKPYNYKCFQCPFTCMEKSHLYNHMKYSLCKNSLSLLIESDWPYKKGNNVPHPDQLRPSQQDLRGAGKEAPDQRAMRTEEVQQRGVEEEAEDRENRGQEEEGEEARTLVKERSEKGDAAECKADSELFMADMLSLRDQLLRARSAEVEAQLKHYKTLSKNCITAPTLLSDQWRLLTASKAKSEGAQARMNSSIPCYPPPPNPVDYQDPAGLNLSVLGVGYPIGPSLFSYMNSTLPATQTHAQLAQLPFLASAAQLIHPASGGHADRTLIPPRLYYPFLCEHSFAPASGQSNANKGPKTSTNTVDAFSLSGPQPQVNLWKVPALRPGATTVSPVGRTSPSDPAYRLGDKVQASAKEGKSSWGLKRPGGPGVNHEAPVEKKPTTGFALEFLKNIQTGSTLNMASDKLSSQNLHHKTRSSEPLYTDHLTSPNPEASSLPASTGGHSSQEALTTRPIGDGASESVAALLNDLSKALQEYQEAERNISHLEKEDLPVQHHLWEHLSKIRNELSHIHQALERTARQSDGPLDLSFKRASANSKELGLKENTAVSDEEEEEDREEEEGKAMRGSLETRKQSLDMLIKMSNAGASVVSPEVLSQGALAIRHSPAEALWPSRTTKCEADSSVLLCPDGRPVMFGDIPPSAKAAKRPSSIQRLEGQCPQSPLMATDT
ncbi:proline-rich protein 35 [Hippocampus zosterae]|uniref:proline-rich protein 35 n=1 Tax=Hippocampus zosterae TaxID=109293 RepID=UPI00223D0657|nr:proline-rich protein 35 [Hippocampus zosterae]XP_051927654.1 proline-rich protein 35 [Hippocampus zosterae]